VFLPPVVSHFQKFFLERLFPFQRFFFERLFLFQEFFFK